MGSRMSMQVLEDYLTLEIEEAELPDDDQRLFSSMRFFDLEMPPPKARPSRHFDDGVSMRKGHRK